MQHMGHSVVGFAAVAKEGNDCRASANVIRTARSVR